jgi:hypothetical protein
MAAMPIAPLFLRSDYTPMAPLGDRFWVGSCLPWMAALKLLTQIRNQESKGREHQSMLL